MAGIICSWPWHRELINETASREASINDESSEIISTTPLLHGFGIEEESSKHMKFFGWWRHKGQQQKAIAIA